MPTSTFLYLCQECPVLPQTSRMGYLGYRCSERTKDIPVDRALDRVTIRQRIQVSFLKPNPAICRTGLSAGKQLALPCGKIYHSHVYDIHLDVTASTQALGTSTENTLGKIGQMSGRFSLQTKRRYEVGVRAMDTKVTDYGRAKWSTKH